jgi:nitrite reductase/ring-hydroxylating ferredoxin subunit
MRYRRNLANHSDSAGRWFSVARSEEVIARHVVQTQILGQEIAVWRDDAGAVNAWENRCPHRGVRLSIGRNNGTELQCQYHGWRFASGSGQCTFIPAHPSQKPASTIHAATHAVREEHGFVWACLDAPAYPLPELPAGATTLRSIVVEAPHAAVAQALLHGYSFAADPGVADAVTLGAEVVATGPFVFRTAGIGERATTVMFLLQPHTESQTVMHAALFDAAPAHAAASPEPPAPDARAKRMALLRHHNVRMTALRDRLEGSP